MTNMHQILNMFHSRLYELSYELQTAYSLVKLPVRKKTTQIILLEELVMSAHAHVHKFNSGTYF